MANDTKPAIEPYDHKALQDEVSLGPLLTWDLSSIITNFKNIFSNDFQTISLIK